jgi:hypothetical protein
MSLNAVLTCSDSSCTSLGVAQSLSLLAPRLAPRMKLASLMSYPTKSAGYSVGDPASRGLAHQQVLFVIGLFISNDDVEPHAHGVPEPAQGLDVRHAAAQFDAREGGLADSRPLATSFWVRFRLLRMARSWSPSRRSRPACSYGVLAGVTGLREAPGLEGLPPAVPGHHAFLSKWWVIVMSCSAWQVFFCSDGPVNVRSLNALTSLAEDSEQDDGPAPGFQKLIRHVVRSSATRSS